jgi:uncharacterized membrane protein YczE
VFTRGLPAAEVGRRLPKLCGAFVLLGVAVALMVRADLGLGPWDVLHQGVSDLIGVPIGTVGILVGLVVLVAWIPLDVRPGLGTILNVILIGASIDVALALLPEDPSIGARWLELLLGVFLFGPGVALYLSCELGAGPRDGIMTAFADRGLSLRVVRTAMELTVLVLGFLLGGSVGVGTVVFALTVGPNIHWFTERIAARSGVVPATVAD